MDPDGDALLLHPTELERVDALLVWRDWLIDLGITQPFAQLYRDSYRPAGGVYTDDRFAGHILLQAALRSSCQAADWRFEIFGGWDGGWEPTLELADHQLEVSFDVSPVGNLDDNHVFKHLQSGSVRFSRPADSIDPIVYSEVMRAIAHFVARSTIAVDGNLDLTGGYSDYWPRWAWGELTPAAEARARALTDVLGRTTLRDVTAIDGPWLSIDSGESRHRVHLGSGLIEGDDGEPLTVQTKPKARRLADQVFLPYEGDAMLRSILARAFALAGFA